jgi:hypothetical protein
LHRGDVGKCIWIEHEPVSGELIDTVAGKRSDPRNGLQLRWKHRVISVEVFAEIDRIPQRAPVWSDWKQSKNSRLHFKSEKVEMPLKPPRYKQLRRYEDSTTGQR